MAQQGSVFEGKTLDDAVKKGLEALRLSRAEAIITIVEEGSGGFLGFGARPAKVRVSPRPGGAPSEPELRGDRDRSRRDRGARSGREDRGGRSDRAPRSGRGERVERGGRGERSGAAAPAGADRGARPEASARGPRRDERPRREDRTRREGDRPRGERPRTDDAAVRPADRAALPPERRVGDERRMRGDLPRGGQERRSDEAPRRHEDRPRAPHAEPRGGRPEPAMSQEPRPERAADPINEARADGAAGDEGRRRRRGRRGGRGRGPREGAPMTDASRVPGMVEESHESEVVEQPMRSAPEMSPREPMAQPPAAMHESPVESREPREPRRASQESRGRTSAATMEEPGMSNEQLAAEGKRWTEQFLQAMGFEGTVTATADEDHVDVTAAVATNDELITGRKGEVRQALQHLLNRMINRGEGSRYHLQLEINDSWKKREDELRELALTLAKEALEKQGEVITEYLNAQERRIVHMTLKEDGRVKTYSLGDGMIKRIAIAPADYQAGPRDDED
jgi:spoIIIJ-associated protein